jgi:hypothetical protein
MAKQNQILKVLAIGAAAAGVYYLFFKKKKGTIAKGDTIMNSASSSTPALPPTKPTTPTASPRVPSTTTSTPTPQPAASYETWIVNTKSTPLNVRGGAGTNFPIVTTLAKGTEVKARQSSISGWIEILDITGYFPKVIGYASSQYLIKK